jgi:prepilin-type N-terminal cleavage/methylation domain-containing protein
MNNRTQKGFTLVELLIVIAILAVLSVTVVVVLNPAELLKQARDSTRISDLASVNSAIALYLTDVATPYLNGPSTACSSATARCTVSTTTSPFTATGNGCGGGTANATTTVDGNGWVAVTLSSITGGSPLARLPIDPINSGNQFYAYACGTGSALNYELNTNMESTKYSSGGSSDVESNSKDGGTNALVYEVGNNLSQ